MPDPLTALNLLGYLVVLAPTLLVVALGLPALVGRPLSERRTQTVVTTTVWAGLFGSLAVMGVMLANDIRHVSVDILHWVAIPHFHFTIKLVFDWLSLPFVTLVFVLSGTVGAFAVRYLHRERGYTRFFVLYAMFVLGMVLAALSDTIETLFAGWELVGLSSALLVAYFHERPAPPRNGLRVWVVYRVSDAALLLAAVIMHHLTGEGDFDTLFGVGPWEDGRAAVTEGQALLVGFLLLVAAAGKSALVPFSGWLPRAMEGPTPSSAVFYGALSVHLGAFMLLRLGPVIDASPVLAAAVVTLGLTTTLYAYVVGGVQTDIKSALSFASLTQVGLIVAEIGLGWRDIALAHLIGHACYRTLQFVRAPSFLQDYRGLENAVGGRLTRPTAFWARWTPAPVRGWIYRFALERGHLDALLSDYVVAPFVRVFRWFDGVERRWTDFLAGKPSRESDEAQPHPERVEELV